MTHPSSSSSSASTGNPNQQQSQQQQTQHFLLKWNNHRTNLVNVFEHLLQHENLVDVTLAIEGKFLKAHKIVLSACSPYFQSMFINQAPEDKHPILIFHDLKFTHMKTLLEFMYRGEISIDERDLSDVLKIAEALSIRGLSSFESEEDDSASGTDAAPNSPPMNNINNNTNNNSTNNNNNSNSYQSPATSSSSSSATGAPASESYSHISSQNSGPPSIIIPNLDNQTSSSSSTNNKALNNGSTKSTKGFKTIKKDKLKKSTSSSVESPTNMNLNLNVRPQINSNVGGSNNNTSEDGSPAVKKKRGRKPLNKGKVLDEKSSMEVASTTNITNPTQAAIIAAVAAAAVHKTPKMSKSKFKTSNSSPVSAAIAATSSSQPHIPSLSPSTAATSIPTSMSPPNKPVRRRIPKRLTGPPLKRDRLDKDSPSDAEDYNNGYPDNTSSEPLSEMSVRGLDLFKYAAIEDGIYRCMECEKLQIPKTFKNKYSFQRHAFLYHEGNMRKVFPCPVCFREFSRPDKMKNHLRSIHEGGGNNANSNGNTVAATTGSGGGGGKSSATSPCPSATDFSTSSVGVGTPFRFGSRIEHCDY